MTKIWSKTLETFVPPCPTHHFGPGSCHFPFYVLELWKNNWKRRLNTFAPQIVPFYDADPDLDLHKTPPPVASSPPPTNDIPSPTHLGTARNAAPQVAVPENFNKFIALVKLLFLSQLLMRPAIYSCWSRQLYRLVSKMLFWPHLLLRIWVEKLFPS